MKNRIILTLIFLLCITFSVSADAPTDMAEVPAGYSLIGAEWGDLLAQTNAKPIHMVHLDSFYMDKYEVTNADYAECVAAGECEAPTKEDSKTRKNYYSDPTFANFPVVNVTWQDAADYCEYVGKRLPTEAEWEKAARGTDSRKYSWGNASPKAKYVNISEVPGDTETVNSHYDGASMYGISDMMGNVSEWTADWYDENAYTNSEEIENPQGPASGTQRVVRGDNYDSSAAMLHVTNRSGMDPNESSDTVGFRCVLDVREYATYDQVKEEEDGPEKQFGYIKAGNDNGIFLLNEPGDGYGDDVLLGIVPNGEVVYITGGPVELNYAKWVRILTQDGIAGWTLSDSVAML